MAGDRRFPRSGEAPGAIPTHTECMTSHPDFSSWYDRLTAIQATLRDGNEAAIKPALKALHQIGDLADDTATEALEDATDALYEAEERPEFIATAYDAIEDCTNRLLVIKEVRGW